MEPMAGAPPVPSGAVAFDAWRELDRTTRRELLRADRPHPDPAVAVVAVGYARAMLARSRLRQTLPFTLAMVVGVVAIGAAIGVLDSIGTVPQTTVTNGLPVAVVVLVVLLVRLRLRARIVALHRMEAVNAAALWNTERSAPTPPPAPRPAPQPSSPRTPATVVVRYSRRYLVRSFAALAVFVVVIEAAVLVADAGVLALVVTVLLAVSIVLTIYNVVVRTRPHLPMMIMNAAGLELPSMGARVAWTDIAELAIHPFRAGRSGKHGRHHAVAFVLIDPDVFRSQVAGYWARKTRTPLTVYGTPLVIADVALDHTAEQIVAAAAIFTPAPIRRFGP
jgi:hypothetical protein